MTQTLSSYAFSTYGHDAALYNGIKDLEDVSSALADALRISMRRLGKGEWRDICQKALNQYEEAICQ